MLFFVCLFVFWGVMKRINTFNTIHDVERTVYVNGFVIRGHKPLAISFLKSCYGKSGYKEASESVSCSVKKH